MKKWKLGLLTAVLALSMTACSAKETPAPEATSAPAAEATATPEPTPEPTATPEPTKEPIVATETFQSLFAKYDIKAGTCLSDFMISNKKCNEIINEQFNSITFENHLKPEAILNYQESVAAGDLVVKFNNTTLSLLEWCKENDMAVRGHTIIWHSQTPNWIFYEDFDNKKNLVSRDVMLKRMESYIKQTFEKLDELGYLEMFYAYDVVNEAWMEDGSMRESLWLETIGEDYIWQAFNFANKYAPEYIDLYYNDYNEQFKTLTLYNFVQTLVDEDGNYLIDGVGFQAHLYTGDNLETYFTTLEKIGSLGLKVCLTELDVSLGTWQSIKPGTDANLRTQGQYYYNLVNGILKRVEEGKVKMDSFTVWGFADNLSWRRERSPLFYDMLYQPKYSFYGALQMKEYAGFPEE